MQISGKACSRVVVLAVAAAFMPFHGHAGPMQCTHLPVITADGARITGIEDMALDSANNRVLLSAYDRHAVDEALASGIADGVTVPEGGLYWLGLEQLEVSPVTSLSATRIAVFAETPVRLLPHGIGLFDHDGVRRLGLVNRVVTPDGISGEVLFFDAAGTDFQLIGRAGGDAFCRANDVVVVDPATALVTYDQANCDGWALWAERAFDRHSAGVLRVTFGTAGVADTRTVFDSVAFANGITLDTRGRIVFAASRDSAVYALTGEALLQGNGHATVIARFQGGPDNITVNESGALIVAVHPSPFALFLHMNGLTRVPTSRVVAVAPDGTITLLVDAETPGVPGAATTALEAAGKLIVSSAWDHGLGVCTPVMPSAADRG